MRAREFTIEGVAGPKKCWPGHRKVGTKPGTGKNAGKRVNDCEKIKNEGVAEGALNEFYRDPDDDEESPLDNYPCYDCGSTIYMHHTELCDLAEDDAIRDLPAKAPGLQHWSGEIPKGLKPIPGLQESFDGEYDDEAGMAEGNLHTLARAVEGLLDTIDDNDNLPEWCQEKIAKAEMMLVSVWDYLQSQKERGIDPTIAEGVDELSRVLSLSGIQLTEDLSPDEQFDIIEEMVEELAEEHGVDAETIWEDFESVDDAELFESAAWRRKEGKSKKGGLNAKGVASYRRENPGSKLQTAVTTKPSKLKKGSKAAKRRKSFCARMGGVKGPMKKPNGKPTRKALALRKWNC